MSPAQFKAWRKSLGLKQKDAAERLGLKKRMIQYYETGRRDGKKVAIPLSVRLACYALSAGVEDFDGAAQKPAEAAPASAANGEQAAEQSGAETTTSAPVTELKKARPRKPQAAA
jgi:transcriptional regulator with XRE-family HTH domain